MTIFERTCTQIASCALIAAIACAPHRAAPSPGVGRMYGDAAPPEAPISLTLSPYIGRLVTTMVTLGDDTLRLLFDTGGGETVLTPSAARRARCRPGPRTTAFRMNGDRVVFEHCRDVTLIADGMALQHSTIAVLDLMALLPKGVPPIDGVLSLAWFARRTLTIDLACRRLIVESVKSASTRTREMTPIASRIATSPSGEGLTLFVNAGDSTPVWLEFDSGNLDHIVVTPDALSALGLDREPVVDGVRSAALSLSGVRLPVATIATRDLIHAGALNERVISAARFTFRLTDGSGWIDVRPNSCGR